MAGYRIGRVLGRGGMGVVYEALHQTLDRQVALKVRRDDGDAVARERFLREARSAASVHDPHVVAVLDAGVAEGFLYLVLEFMPGGSLHDLIQRSPANIPLAEALRLLRDAASGLAEVHAAGFLHRDLKPANILIALNGTAKIADFGLVKVSGAVALTGAGFIGTPRYLAPEVVSQRPADVRSDLYALGVTFYELLTGRTPFSGESPIEVLYAIVHVPVPPLATYRRDLPSSVVALVKKLMDRDPQRRPASAAQLLDDIAVLALNQSAASPSRRSLMLPLMIIVAAMVIAAIILLIPQTTGPTITARKPDEARDAQFAPSSAATTVPSHVIITQTTPTAQVTLPAQSQIGVPTQVLDSPLPPVSENRVAQREQKPLEHAPAVQLNSRVVNSSTQVEDSTSQTPIAELTVVAVQAGHSATAQGAPAAPPVETTSDEPPLAATPATPATTRPTLPINLPPGSVVVPAGVPPPARQPPAVPVVGQPLVPLVGAGAPPQRPSGVLVPAPVERPRVEPTLGDPFANDLFATGWRQVHARALAGVYAVGEHVVAWGVEGVSLSRDQGATWTPAVPIWDQGLVTVSEAVIAEAEVWVRGSDGSVRVLGERRARNDTLGIGAVSRLAPCAGGLLALEEAVGRVSLLQRGILTSNAPGRLVVTMADGAVVDDGTQARWLGVGGTQTIRRPTTCGMPASSSGPAGTATYTADGQLWERRDGRAVAVSRIATRILCLGFGAGPAGDLATALTSDDTRGLMVAGMNAHHELHGSDATEGLPPGTVAVALLGKDRLNRARVRLIAVGASGCWLYRFR